MYLLALIPCDLLAVWPGLGCAVGRLLNLAGEGVGHLGPCAWSRLMVPQLLLVATGHIWYDELHVLGDQLALLPGDGLAVVSSSPDLIQNIDKQTHFKNNVQPVLHHFQFPRG